MKGPDMEVRADEIKVGDKWENGRTILARSSRVDGLATLVSLTYKVPGHGLRTDEYLADRLLPVLPREERPTYRERREAKAERLREWAGKREVKAEAAGQRARQISDMIPFGQPILVGHHSEGRHRRDLGRIESGWRASIENADKAATFRSRADNIEAAAEHAIYSDDADAIERLTERIASLEAERDRIKRYNATCRKGAPDRSILDDAQRVALDGCLRYDAWQCKGDAFPGYHLTNLSGNIARNRKRLEQLSR